MNSKQTITLLPRIAVPYVIHENTARNAYYSEKFRQCKLTGSFDPCHSKWALDEFRNIIIEYADKLKMNISANKTLTPVEWIKLNKNFSKGKKLRITKAIGEYDGNTNYKLFVKEEFLNAPSKKVGRCIHYDVDASKAHFGPEVKLVTDTIKKYFTYQNKNNQKHHRSIWTSGMNCDEIGRQFTHIIKEYEAYNITPYFWSLDFSKFDSSQRAELLLLMLEFYYRISDRQLFIKLKELVERAAATKVVRYINREEETRFKYVIAATRLSGDMDTTLTNTLLGMMLTKFIITNCRDKINYDHIWSFNAGDDILLVIPDDLKDLVEPEKLDALGMKLTVEGTYHPSEIDYNSRFFLRIFDTEAEEERYHLSSKFGRILSKTPMVKSKPAFKFHTNDESDYRYKAALTLAAEKALAMSVELKMLPGLSKLYARIAKNRKGDAHGMRLSETLRKLVKQSMITEGNFKATTNTYIDIFTRYGVTEEDLRSLEIFSETIRDNDYCFEDKSDFHYVSHIFRAFVQRDTVQFDKDDIEAFAELGYNQRILNHFKDYYM